MTQPLDVAFYGPLKRYWRKILDGWKASGQKKAKTLNKDVFPSLLKKLYALLYPSNTETSTNLQAGFKKCGIFPLDPSQVLRRLPEASLGSTQEEPENVRTSVSDIVLGMLKTLRGVDDEKNKQPRRRKKINVPPGKSIGYEDLAQLDLEGPGPSRRGIDSENEDNGRDKKIDEGKNDPENDTGNETEDELTEESENELENLDAECSSADKAVQDDLPVTTTPAGTKHNMAQTVTVGQFVMVDYEGSKFPGQVTSLEKDGAVVSVLAKSKAEGWRWPKSKDELLYFWRDIIQIIPAENVKPINSRGFYRILDMEGIWGK